MKGKENPRNERDNQEIRVRERKGEREGAELENGNERGRSIYGAFLIEIAAKRN